MAECYCTMMWETFFDQDMTIESAHFRNSKDTDGSKGTCCHRKDFTLSHISTKFIVCCALQTVKCDVTRFNISLKCTLCHFLRQCSCHNLLVLHLAEGQLAGSCIAAVEAHECIFLSIVIFTLYIAVVHIRRYRIVDIQQCNCILADNRSDKLAECTVNIHFTGYRNTLSRQTAVDITWHKAELCLECRPAFARQCYILAIATMLFDPVF